MNFLNKICNVRFRLKPKGLFYKRFFSLQDWINPPNKLETLLFTIRIHSAKIGSRKLCHCRKKLTLVYINSLLKKVYTTIVRSISSSSFSTLLIYREGGFFQNVVFWKYDFLSSLIKHYAYVSKEKKNRQK